ncbi:MAG: transcriptional regulator [Acidimicrobiaceae bacterium]|nr:transcriptional regulator [Acidimicrobiaceae bacterium]
MNEDEEVSDDYALRVGLRLRSVRKQKHLSLHSVEAASNQEFKASVLGAYERGERSISVPRLQRLAELYNVPVDQLLPKQNTSKSPLVPLANFPMAVNGREETVESFAVNTFDERRAPMVEPSLKVTIDLIKLNLMDGPEKELLRRYLSMLQVQRQDFNGRMITIRHEDLKVLACLFELTAEEMARRFDELGLRIMN